MRAAEPLQPKEHDHGQESKAPSVQEGEDRRREGQGQAPQAAGGKGGAQQMNYTLTQAIDRTKDLSGIIKAARAHEADCAADHEAKKNIAEIAGEAHSKAIAAVVALEQEREELADHVAALVRRTGEPMAAEEPKLVCRDSETGAIQSGYGEIVADAARFNSFFSTADTLADRLMANGEAKVNEALNRAQEGF